MMKLGLTRTLMADYWTGGWISVDGIRMCVSLELPVRDGLPGSAIPEGIYPINLRPSPKFLALSIDPKLTMRDRGYWERYAGAMPHIDGIDKRSDIMLHPGNTPEDTDGCVLVGQQMQTAYITNSRLAFSVLYANIVSGVKLSGCQIEVSSVKAA